MPRPYFAVALVHRNDFLTAIPLKWYEPVRAILSEVNLLDSSISEREIERCGT